MVIPLCPPGPTMQACGMQYYSVQGGMGRILLHDDHEPDGQAGPGPPSGTEPARLPPRVR